MRYGFYLPTRGPTATRADILRLAREGERLGLHSAMIADHIVFPVESESPYPYTLDGKHPGTGDALETFSILGVVAGATEKLRLVTSVLVLPYRNPVLTAKMVASLDVLSGGRVTLGVGVGWLKEEFEALDSPDFERRGAVTDEWIAIFKQLWSRSPASFDGKFYKYTDIRCEPFPLQKPHPPIWVGGHSKAALRRTARHGDGWHPVGAIAASPLPPQEMRAHLQTLKQMTEAEGRDFSKLTISYKAPLYDTSVPDRDGSRRSFSGTARRDRGRHPLVCRHRRARADLRLPRQLDRRQRGRPAALRGGGDPAGQLTNVRHLSSSARRGRRRGTGTDDAAQNPDLSASGSMRPPQDSGRERRFEGRTARRQEGEDAEPPSAPQRHDLVQQRRGEDQRAARDRPVELAAELGETQLAAVVLLVGIEVEAERELAMRGVAAGVVAVTAEAAAALDVVAADDRRLDHHDADVESPQDRRHDAPHQAIAQLDEQPGIVELNVVAALDVAVDDIALQPAHRVGDLVLALPVVDQRAAQAGIDHALEQQHRRLGLHDGRLARRVELRHSCCNRIGRRLRQHCRHTAAPRRR